MSLQYGLGTRSVHAGEAPDPSTGAHGVPLYQNVTYAFRSYDQLEATRAGQAPHFTYSPRGNPTVRSLELKLADLEGSETAVATASGMAAISATLLQLTAGGGHLIASSYLYEQTRLFLEQDLPCAGGSVTFVDCANLDAVEAAMTDATRAIIAEPFSNPTLQVANIREIASVAHRRQLPLVVDNTFLSPALLRPIEHGADLVIHSATKYLSGHGHVQGGVVCGTTDRIAPIKEKLIRLGSTMGPHAAWLLLAGIKTLALRMDRHCENAAGLATLLARDAAVAEVNYPGLPDHPGHATASELVGANDGQFGGMLSFTLKGGTPAKRAFINSLEFCAVAVSLGDCGTLVWPWVGSDLIRVSVGIEDLADLEREFRRGLKQAKTCS